MAQHCGSFSLGDFAPSHHCPKCTISLGRNDFFPPNIICPEWIRRLRMEPYDYVKNVQMPVGLPYHLHKQRDLRPEQPRTFQNKPLTYVSKGTKREISPFLCHMTLESSGMQELGQGMTSLSVSRKGLCCRTQHLPKVNGLLQMVLTHCAVFLSLHSIQQQTQQGTFKMEETHITAV